MKKLSRNSIVITLTVVIVTLIGLDIFIWERTKAFLISEIKEDLSKNINLAREIINQEAFYKYDKAELKNFSDIIRQTTGLRTTIISKDGEVLADSELEISNLNDVENHINRAEIQSSLETGSGFSRRHSATIKKDLLYYCENFHQDNRVVGFIRFAMFATSLDNKMDFLSKLILLIDTFVLALVCMFLFVYHHFLQNRIKDFVNTIERHVEQDPFTEIESQKYFEFDLIAGKINSIGNYYQNNYDIIKQDNTELHRIFDAMKEGIAAFDRNGKLLFYNEAFKRYFKIELDKKPETYFYDLIQFPPIINAINDFLHDKTPFVDRTKYTNSTHLDYSITPLMLDENNYHGFVISFEDVTNLHNLEVIRKDFVANISHEFKTPLTSIKGYTETLLSGTVEDQKTQKKFLNKILNQSNHLVSIFMDVITLSRIENTETLEFEKINPMPLIEELVTSFKIEAEAKSIKFEYQNKLEKEIKIKGDLHLIRIMLSNILINAIKYSKANGKVELTLSKIEKNLLINVIDTGIGIPEKEQTRIFERFYRTDISREVNPEGSGLGLSIVKNIVELLDGNIHLKSERKKGSTFSISLPLSKS